MHVKECTDSKHVRGHGSQGLAPVGMDCVIGVELRQLNVGIHCDQDVCYVCLKENRRMKRREFEEENSHRCHSSCNECGCCSAMWLHSSTSKNLANREKYSIRRRCLKFERN